MTKSRNRGLASYAASLEEQEQQPTPEDTQSAWDKHWKVYNDWYRRSFEGLIAPYTKAHFKALNQTIAQQNAELANLHAKVEGLTRLVLGGHDADQIDKRFRELCADASVTYSETFFSAGDPDEDADAEPKEPFKSIFKITETAKPPQQEPPTDSPSWFSRLLRQR